MKRPLFNLFALVLAVSIVLVACGAPAATQAPATQSETQASTTAGAKSVTVTIGFTASQTGSLEVSSTRQVNGFNLWMNQVNKAGGVTLSNGTVVTFASKSYDDESKKENVQQLYTTLINDDHADFLISPYSSGLTAAASVIAEQNGKVMITTGAADDNTYKQGYTRVFQLYTPGSAYLKSTVDLLKKYEPNAKIAIIHEAESFTESVVNGLVPYAQSQGFDIVMQESYASDTTDFGPLINKMVDSGATVLLGGGHYPDGSTFARQIKERKVKLNLIALLVAPADSKFAELGDAAIGVMTSSQWELEATHTEAEAKKLGIEWFGPSGTDFAAAYKAAYNDDPSYHAAGGYAAGLILQKAIMSADSVDPEAVKKALDAMNIFTFFGGTKFDISAEAHGLQVNHDMVVAQWQKDASGNLVRQVIWPADIAVSDPLYPIP